MKTKGIVVAALAALAAFALSACNSETTSDGREIVCTTEVVPALIIEVFEQETGFPNACGVTVSITDGNYVEEQTNSASETCDNSYTFAMADERAGRYDISIVKTGFQEWTRSNIEVTSNVCHVNTVTLQAYLEK